MVTSIAKWLIENYPAVFFILAIIVTSVFIAKYAIGLLSRIKNTENECTKINNECAKITLTIEKLGADINSKLENLQSDVNSKNEKMGSGIDLKIEKMGSGIDLKFEKMESRIDLKLEKMESKIDSKLEKMESRIDSKLDEMESRIDSKLDEMESRIDLKLEKIDLKIENLGSKLEEVKLDMNSKFDKAESRTDLRLEKIESKIDNTILPCLAKQQQSVDAIIFYLKGKDVHLDIPVVQRNSPIQLTAVGHEILVRSGGKDFIDQYKFMLLDRLSEHSIKSPLDVEKFAETVLWEFEGSDGFTPIKDFVYYNSAYHTLNGRSVDMYLRSVITVMSIYLRNVYLTEYPSILQKTLPDQSPE
jgi:hypothetical protein